MTPLQIWLLGEVVIPDAYSRIVGGSRREPSEKRIASDVKRLVHPFPKRTWLRWYRQQSTWDDLVAQGEDAHRRLVATLADTKRALRGPIALERAEQIVEATVDSFVRNLPPSQAVEVADYRSADRDFTHEALETERARTTLNKIDQLTRHVEDNTSFDDRLLSIPTLVRPALLAAKGQAGAERLVGMVVGDDPRAALVALTTDLPDWLLNAEGESLVAAAELARSYQVHNGAGVLFELAADVMADRSYYWVRAALEFSTAENGEKVASLLARARELGTSPDVEALAAAI